MYHAHHLHGFHQRVVDSIRAKLPATTKLTFFGMLITLLVEVPLGVYPADKHRFARAFFLKKARAGFRID